MNTNILKDISYGMYLVTSNHENTKSGCIINTLSQVTSESKIVSITLNKNNFTNEIIKKSKTFAVSILSEETPSNIIGTFGFKTSKNYNKFEGVSIINTNNQYIVNENICGYIICEVINIISVDTHDIFIAKIIDAEKTNSLTPMTYSYYHKVIKGSAPPNAPTYTKENSQTKTYKCLICGYEYTEDEVIKFKQLPNDWKCPICGAPKDVFELKQ